MHYIDQIQHFNRINKHFIDYSAFYKLDQMLRRIKKFDGIQVSIVIIFQPIGRYQHVL